MSKGSVMPASLHRIAGALHDAGDAGLADEHVVGFLGQHEAAGARQRIEARLRQRVQLHLAVAVGEVGEHEERQPVRRRLVEGAEHARRIRIARAAAQQIVGLLAAVAAEVLLQQVDHRPEMAAFLDIDLEQIAHVVERGRGLAEMALLLDRGRLGVALDHDQAAQHRAMLAGDFLPGRLAEVFAERNDAVLFLRRKQDAPAIFGHPHVVELGPAARIDRIGGAQIDQRLLEAIRAHILPPVHVTGMPALQRLQHLAVFGEIHIVRNLGRVIDVHDVHVHGRAPFWSRFGRGPRLLTVLRGRADFGVLSDRSRSPAMLTALAPRRHESKPASCRIAPSGRCRSGAARRPRRPRWAAGRSSSATR